MAKEMLFPQRKNCKKCRSKLDRHGTVLDGLYCSYKCGGYSAPITELAKAPRHCVSVDSNGNNVKFKRKWLALDFVRDEIRKDSTSNFYFCDNCHFLHVGHSRATGKETARLISNPKELGSVLLRIRGDRDIKEVAARIKVRPIRIKEIEAGLDTMSLDVLFALMKHYRLKLNLLLP